MSKTPGTRNPLSLRLRRASEYMSPSPTFFLTAILAAFAVLAAAGRCTGTPGRLYSPGNERAYAEYAAGVYAELNKEDELALQHYRRAANGLPESPEVALRLGTLYLKMNIPQSAQRYLSRASDLAPDDDLLKITAARVCALVGLPQKGIEHIKQVLHDKPNSSEDYFETAKLIAEFYEQLGMWASAADTYSKLAELPEKRAVAQNRLGQLYLKLSYQYKYSRQISQQMLSLSRAMSWFREIESLTPGLTPVTRGMGDCYYETLQFDKAASLYETYLRRKPFDTRIMHKLALCRRENNDIEEAIDLYRKLIIIKPASFRIHAEFLEILLQENLLDQAVDAAVDCAAQFPKNPKASLSAAKCFFMVGDYENAEEYLQKTIDIGTAYRMPGGGMLFKKDLKEATFLLGTIHLYGGNDDRAMHYFGLTLEIDPEHADANNNLGYLTLESGGDPESALRLVRRAIRIRPRCGQFLDSLGWIYFKMGRTEEAIEKLLEAAGLVREAEIHNHLGRIYESEGRIQEARREWEKSLEIDPDYRPAFERIIKSYDMEEHI